MGRSDIASVAIGVGRARDGRRRQTGRRNDIMPPRTSRARAVSVGGGVETQPPPWLVSPPDGAPPSPASPPPTAAASPAITCRPLARPPDSRTDDIAAVVCRPAARESRKTRLAPIVTADATPDNHTDCRVLLPPSRALCPSNLHQPVFVTNFFFFFISLPFLLNPPPPTTNVPAVKMRYFFSISFTLTMNDIRL